MRLRLVLALLFGSVAASAQDTLAVADSTTIQSVKKNSRAIKPVTYIIPAAMITYGFIALESKPLIQLDQNIKQTIWDKNPHKTTGIDDYTGFVPIVAVYALNMAGVKGKHNFVDRTLLLGLSYALAGAIVTPVKHLTHKFRPDGSNRLSFPSGHTSQAFVSAEFLRMEYKDVSPWYGVAGYTVAAATGCLRMYNNKHWMSDVIAGAGVGILSVQFVYWVYPKLKQNFTRNKNGTAMIVPYYRDKEGGLLCIVHLR
ncbi:MAG: phosphatase PAP2 family protein [Chitinophagaceae bacterium]|nr:phosphatase PAP2 family protein [Chitinophagaceae bacterium]